MAEDDLNVSRGTARSLASLSIVDGGLEVDLGEATLQINSAGSIDINVREGGSPRSRRSRRSSHGLDDFLENRSLDASLVEHTAARTAMSLGLDFGDDDVEDDDDNEDDKQQIDQDEGETGIDFAHLLREDDDSAADDLVADHDHDAIDDENGDEIIDDDVDDNDEFSGHTHATSDLEPPSLNTSLEARLKRLEALLEDEANASRDMDTSQTQQNPGVDLSETKASLEARMQRLDKLLQTSSSHDDMDDDDVHDDHHHHEDDHHVGIDNSHDHIDNDARFNARGPPRSDNGSESQAEMDTLLGGGRQSPSKTIASRSPPGGRRSPLGRDDAMPGEQGLGLSALDERMAEDDIWERMNRALQQAGFGAINMRDVGGPEPGAMLSQLRSILAQYHRRGEMIEELTMEESSSKRTDEELYSKLEQSRREVARLQERLKGAQAEVREAQDKQSATHRGDAEQVRALQRENAALQQKLSLSEHRVRAKEGEMERMHKKLATEARHTATQRERTRAVFRDVAKRDPRAASQTDQKLLDIVEAFETERRELHEERDLLNAEVRRLNHALEDRENELNGSRASSLDEIERSLLRKARDVEADQRVSREAMDRRERAIIAKLSKLEGQLAEARRAEQRAADHVENLKLELASRPTMRDWKAAQRRITKLEAQVQSAVEALEESEIDEARRNNIFVARPSRGGAGNGDTRRSQADGDHLSPRDRVELMAKRALAEASDNRRRTSTAELIRRDKLNHRLGLSRLTALPKTAAHEILQEICRILELADVDLIVPALQKMCWVVRAMPRLERFAKDISGFVLLHGDDLLRETAQDPSVANPTSASLQAILPQLKRWVNDVRTVTVWREFREDLLHELSRAPSMALPSGNPHRTRQSCDLNNAQIVQAVRDLVSLERGMMDHQTAFRAADDFLANNPDALVSRCVAHFQQLFELRSVEGVIPKMNELYVYTNEMRNFMQVLRPTVGLGSNASVHACLAKLQDLSIGPVARSSSGDQDDPEPKAVDDKSDGAASASKVDFAVDLRLPRWEDGDDDDDRDDDATHQASATNNALAVVRDDDASPQEEHHHFLD
ncbi:Centrosomal protein of 70 kDa [Hondaea fermentalgiana]|uniref:Centrosomal protein of 70 kDa n=1 Tax=Hondaea fermentalgiana TaxID=2315210 RepID=A0A2R5GSP8_9STRA|nr:Centrosomal protein of 70 kDa [Hondaea fermentalgiana]|eukprot:GBG31673.1 Centrosomal protein of 70 kDa [Hondaea fermentalgiana]